MIRAIDDEVNDSTAYLQPYPKWPGFSRYDKHICIDGGDEATKNVCVSSKYKNNQT